MASNKRKKTFPKKPIQFHSKLAHELGKWSNKNGYEASLKGIYYTKSLSNNIPKVSHEQEKQLAKLRKNLAKRNDNDEINYEW